MTCIAIAKSLISFVPIVQTNDTKLAHKVLGWFKKNHSQDGTIFTLVSGSEDYGVEPAESYLWD